MYYPRSWEKVKEEARGKLGTVEPTPQFKKREKTNTRQNNSQNSKRVS